MAAPSIARTQPEPGLLHYFAALSGTAALAIGAIYAAGLIVRSGELSAAGYSPQDVIPLVPFQQFLARGAGALLDPAVFLVLLLFAWQRTGGVLADVAFDRGDLSRKVNLLQARGELERRVLALAEHLEDRYSTRDVPRASVHEIRGFVARARDLLAVPSDRNVHFAQKLIVTAGDKALALAEAQRDDSRELRELEQILPANRAAFRRYRRWVVAISSGLVLASFGLILFGPLAAAPPIAVLFVGFGYAFLRLRADRGLPRHWVAVLLAIAAFAYVMGEAYWSPRPLQQVWMHMNDGRVVKGELVTTAGTDSGVWYMGQRSATELRAVKIEDALSVRVFRRPGATTKFANKHLWTLLAE